jgi:hypothetical protein
MAVLENLPFPRGTTAFGLQTTPTTTDLTTLEGREFWVQDVNPITKVRRSNQQICLRVVRNTNTVPLYPKQLVTFPNSSSFGSAVNAYSRLGTPTADKAYPVDEYLPVTGCPVNDLCYIVVKGPALCMTSTAGSAENLITAGTFLVAATGTTAGVTTSITQVLTSTAGKVAAITTNTTFQAMDVFNSVGVAMSARTTANTAATTLGDILVNVGRI